MATDCCGCWVQRYEHPGDCRFDPGYVAGLLAEIDRLQAAARVPQTDLSATQPHEPAEDGQPDTGNGSVDSEGFPVADRCDDGKWHVWVSEVSGGIIRRWICASCGANVMGQCRCEHDRERHGPESGCIECRCGATS